MAERGLWTLTGGGALAGVYLGHRRTPLCRELAALSRPTRSGSEA